MPSVAMSLQDAMGDSRIEGPRSNDGKPDGVIFGVPELEHATEEEKQAFLRRLVEHPEEVIPRAQRGPVFAPPPEAAGRHTEPRRTTLAAGAEAPPGPTRAPAAPVFTPPADRDLFDADEALFDPESYRTEPLTMPNGKRLWVHPTSFAERLEITKRARWDLKRGGYLEPCETREEQEQQALDRHTVGAALVQLYQTVRCARKGPEPGALPVFQEKHLDALKRNPGWGAAIEAIAALSDQLSDGATEATALKEMLRDFFGRLQSVHEICSSRLKAAYGEAEMPEPVRQVCDFLEDCAASVSALRRPGKPWGAFETSSLALVLGLPE